MKAAKKVFELLRFLILVYTFILLTGSVFFLLRLTGRIKVIGGKNLKKSKRGTLIISNHASIVDGFVIPSLYFPGFLLNPIRRGPWSTSDKKNFFNLWYLSWTIYLRIILVDRDSKDPDRNKFALEKIIQALKSGQTVIIFPEGGRTWKQPVKIRSPLKGKEIGIFKHGAERIIQRCDCDILPVWLEGTEKVMPMGSGFPNFFKSVITVRIGEPTGKKLTTPELENLILSLADQS